MLLLVQRKMLELGSVPSNGVSLNNEVYHLVVPGDRRCCNMVFIFLQFCLKERFAMQQRDFYPARGPLEKQGLLLLL